MVGCLFCWFNNVDDDDDDDDDDDGDDKLFLRNGWPTKGVLALFTDESLCQRFSPKHIADMPPLKFEPAQKMGSDFVEWSCAILIITAPVHRPNDPLFGQLVLWLVSQSLYCLVRQSVGLFVGYAISP